MAVLAFSFPSSSAIFTMNLTTLHDMDVKGYVNSNMLDVLREAKTIEDNDYVLTQILIRVPLKDIITFKCVSKWWLSLITDPFFSRCLATVKQRVSNLFLDLAPDTRSYQEVKFFYLTRKPTAHPFHHSSPKTPIYVLH
ncbi:hypothetical protein Ahy_B01g056237 [Arachis hypogaea]|uniref:F-box domain-containing protein n=1 Tax=Arachis hypogaea TaxID=3818 RepID=A0A445AYE7_ARAHY|nr:hypothetical protein Ahy_B01g056237 [Arachis hypogaea]